MFKTTVLPLTKHEYHQSQPSMTGRMPSDGAELSCLRRENGGLLMRLWESRGKNSKIKCVLNQKINSCILTDAAGTNIKPLLFQGSSIDLQLKPFEIITLFVK